MGGDQAPVVEYSLDHRQLTVDGRLGDDAPGREHTFRLQRGGECRHLGRFGDPSDPGRGGPDRGLDVHRKFTPGGQGGGRGEDGAGGLGEVQVGQRRSGGDLVLHAHQRVERGHDGGDSRGAQGASRPRQDGNLLLGGKEQVEAPFPVDRDGGVQPRERLGPVGRDGVESSDVPGEPGQGERVGCEHLYDVTSCHKL